MKEEIYKRLSNIREKSPVLLIEKAAVLFREDYSREVYRVDSQEELRDLVERFTNTPYQGLLVIEDISKVYDMSVLLKFLEEASFPIILLAYKDCVTVSETILSRVKTVIKYPYSEVRSNLVCAREGIDLWRAEQDKSDQDRFFAQESPELYYLKLKSSKYVCNTKIVDLLSLEG